MADTRRNQLKTFVEREFIGPDPIDWEGTKQENGEEILSADAPSTRYIAGILFPGMVSEDSESESLQEEMDIPEQPETAEIIDTATEELPQNSGTKAEYLEDAEELINRSNAYRQSAMSMTVGIMKDDNIRIYVSAGTYTKMSATDSRTGKKVYRYPRTAINWNNNEEAIKLPTVSDGIKQIKVGNTKLQMDITYRYKKGDFSIYTFTLENTNKGPDTFNDEQCFFQVKFRLESELGFSPLPDSQRVNVNDEDYQSNQLLYRNVRNYAIGHGCAADWEDSENGVHWIESAIFPSYEGNIADSIQCTPFSESSQSAAHP